MEADNERLELSRLFTLTVYALSYRPLTALTIAVVTIYLPSLVVARFVPPPEEVFSMESMLWALKSTPIYSVAAIFQSWVAFQALEGNASVSALRSTLMRLPTLYTASAVVMLVAVAGVYAFIIPGVIWGLACTVVIPAAAIERVGVVQSIQRSFELTRGRRLALLGYALAILLPMALASMLVELAFVGWRFDQLETSPVKGPLDAVSAMVSAAFSAAAYVELMNLKRSKESRITPSMS